jgi:chromosome segregation and condensation protein ScpB
VRDGRQATPRHCFVGRFRSAKRPLVRHIRSLSAIEAKCIRSTGIDLRQSLQTRPCIHRTAELTLTSNRSAASCRDAPASTHSTNRVRRSNALSDLPQPLRWREYMMRVEAVIFAASQPVSRETLAALIGSDCNLDLIIADIRDELRSRPYELVDVAGGFQHRTRRIYGEVIRGSGAVAAKGVVLTQLEKLVLTAVAYFQPVTRAGLADILGRNVSRDVIAALRRAPI